MAQDLEMRARSLEGVGHNKPYAIKIFRKRPSSFSFSFTRRRSKEGLNSVK